MLLNCIIIFLYMRVLKIIFGKYFSTLFPSIFQLFVWSVRTVALYVRTVRQVCPDIPNLGQDMRFSAISYLALRPDDISDTSGQWTLEG
jgi:hypothetical protein